MEKKETTSYIFTKILLIAVLIFIGLALYAYKMIKDEKENSHKNSVILNNTPIPHPPLTQRDEKEDKPINLELNNSFESNKTTNIPEGAEYISPEEQEEREANLSNFEDEELLDDQIIPQDEINNYEEAVTIPMSENETIHQVPTSTNPFNNPLLGTPIGTQNNQQHPTLGTPIGNSPSSPF